MIHDPQMPKKLRTRRSSSVYDIQTLEKEVDPIFYRVLDLPCHYKITLGNFIGVILSFVTLTLHCIAFFTPHWKEISPNRQPLYIDGIDALIRTEVLTYYNAVHRDSRHSYGLFQRCEYPLANTSRLDHERKSHLYTARDQRATKCTKNFLPSFNDDEFDLCHSLEYYRFCSKTSERVFDVNNDYLRTAFHLATDGFARLPSRSSCSCQTPIYIKACQILGTLALVFLALTSIFLSVFPLLKARESQLKVKCFGILSAILAILCLLVNLITALSHFQYEPLEYLHAIEKHYRSGQIYKLSLDTKLSIERLLSTINIHLGYSAILAWIALVLSLIVGILFMLSCRVKKSYEDREAVFRGISRDSSQETDDDDHEPPFISSVVQAPTEIVNDSELPLLTPSTWPPTPDISEESHTPEKTQPIPPVSCLKRQPALRAHFEDEA